MINLEIIFTVNRRIKSRIHTLLLESAQEFTFDNKGNYIREERIPAVDPHLRGVTVNTHLQVVRI